MYHSIFAGDGHLIIVVIVYTVVLLKVTHELSELLPES